MSKRYSPRPSHKNLNGENNMNNPKTTSRIWKDSRHKQGSEFRQEVRNVKALQSYSSNPKQAWRKGKKRNQNQASARTIQILEMERGLRADGNYSVQNGVNVAWICESSVIVPKPKSQIMPKKSFDFSRIK